MHSASQKEEARQQGTTDATVPFRTLPQYQGARLVRLHGHPLLASRVASLPMLARHRPPVCLSLCLSVYLSVWQVRGRHDEAKLQRVSHTEGAGGERLAQGHEEVHGRAQQPQGYGTDGRCSRTRVG